MWKPDQAQLQLAALEGADNDSARTQVQSRAANSGKDGGAVRSPRLSMGLDNCPPLAAYSSHR